MNDFVDFRNRLFDRPSLLLLFSGKFDIFIIFQMIRELFKFHGHTKDWFFHIKGLGQTMMWGSEEPILSVKSWFAGGDVRLMKSVKLGHKFRDQSPYSTNFSHIHYNKIAYMYMLFPPELYEFLKSK